MSIRQDLSLLVVSVLVPAVIGVACGSPTGPAAPASPSTGAVDPAARADEAAMYALPLVIMDLTREQFFADPIAAEVTANQFLHIPILGNPSFRSVVRPNVDTLYSTAWLDLSREPVMMTVPPSNGRYYLVQCMDAWTNVFAAPGIRTLGDKGARYAFVGPDWKSPLPTDVEVVRAPTPMVWVLGRIYVRDAADLSAARTFQRQIDLRPVSRVGDAAFGGVYPRPRPPGSTRRIMRELLHEMTPAAFFERFTRLTVANPPSPADPKVVAEVLAPLGIAPGSAVAWTSLEEGQRSALTGGLERVLRTLEDRRQLDEQRPVTPTGWSSMAAKLAQGTYGTSYRIRAAVAVIGLGANLRADAIYMNANVDGNRQPLDGSKRYRLTFAKDQAPPVRAFWSVTLYDEQGYLIANPAERYAVKSGDDLVREPDGSLAIYLSPDAPGPSRTDRFRSAAQQGTESPCGECPPCGGPAHHANWLPTPAGQRFELSLRAYWPGDELLDGRWQPPAVTPE